MKGVDYAWANPKPSPACLAQHGVGFVCRYLSHDPSKDLTSSELHALNADGIVVCANWETTATRMLDGWAAGNADAYAADNLVLQLGMKGVPLYFSCDFDATESQQAAINAYLDGVAAHIGRGRTGMYGGYWPVSRAFNAGKITWAWQAFAWSGGQWDKRAQLRQVQNDVWVCGQNCDWDESMTSDFGQWPRPGGPQPPKPVPPKPTQAPPFPYPSTDYLGMTSSDPHCHSGYYSSADNANVKRWQQQMLHRGWVITTDGYYGTQSDSVCRQFQAEKHLAVDGKVGPTTWSTSWTSPVT